VSNAPAPRSSTTTDVDGIAVPIGGPISEPDFDIDDAAEAKPSKPQPQQAPAATPVAPPLPFVPPTSTPLPELSAEQQAQLRERIDALSKEARAATAAGNPPSSAPLWFEAGRIFEHELGNNRDAAAYYQESHKSDPTYLPVIHAARRLFAQLGKWGMVVMLIDEELRLPGAPQAALLVEKARILESRLARPEDALACHRLILQAEPAHAGAVDAVVRALSQSGAYAQVVDVLVAAVAAADRDGLKAAWLLEAARLCETRLGDDARALALVERADALIPNRRPVLEMLRRLYARSGDTAKLGAVLDTLADNAPAAIEAVAFLSERARVVAVGEGGERAAIAALEEARARAPEDSMVLAELCRLYERAEMWSSLADAVEARALACHDKRERAAWLADAGRIAEDRLGEVERAIRLYRACVEIDPSDQVALLALGRLFAKTQRYDDLSHIYDVQLSTASDATQKVSLLFKHAELLAGPLDDVETALARLREVLALWPGYVPAAKMAASLCTKLGRFEELVAIWEGELKHTFQAEGGDKDQALYLLEKVAAVAEDQLGSPERAIDAYVRMLKLAPGHLPALRSLGRLYGQLERWEDLLRVNLEEAQSVSDQNLVVSLYFKNGEVLSEKLGRVDDAIESFNRALQLMPTYLPALKALGGIYARAGRFAELVAMHRQEAEVTKNTAHRAHLLFIAAELVAGKLGDVDGAVVAYRGVLAEDAAHHPSIRALQRIARQTGNTEMLLEVMRSEIDVVSDARDRALLRCRIADVLERQVARTDDAVAALEDAVRDAPTLLVAHEQLVALLGRHNRSGAEAAARERMNEVLPDAQSRVANLRALVDLYTHRLDDPARALDAAGRLLVLLPGDRPALRQQLACALRLRDYRAATSAATALAAVEPSSSEVANLHLQIATWRESHLEPAEDALPNYLRILEFEPQHPIALRAVERHYVERRAHEALFALYEREGQGLEDPRLVVDNAMKMGELAEGRLQRLDVARQCYERAHNAMRDYLPAITRLKDLYGREGRPQDQLRLLTLEAQTSKDPAHAIRTLLEVGSLQRDKFGDVDAAADCFSRVLDRDPMHASAYPSLEALYVGASKWAELARLYERRADALLAHPALASSTLPQTVELLLRAAHLNAERMQNKAEAMRLYERVVAKVPTHPAALLNVGHLAFALRDWDKALAAYTTLLPVAGDPVMLVPVHFNLASIYVEQGTDPTRAIQHLTAGLAMQPDNRDARQLLARAYVASGSPAQALQAYKQLCDSAVDKREKRELHLTLARLFETSFPDPAQAAANLEAAMLLADDPAEKQKALDDVAALYERAGNLQGLLDSTTRQAEAQLASTPPQGRRAAELFFRNARIASERMNNPEVGLKFARRALELAPDVFDVRAFVADLTSRVPNQALLAIEEHRKLVKMGRVRVASLRALYRAWGQQRAHDRAFCAAEILSFLAAAADAEELFFADNKKRVKKDSPEQLTLAQLTNWVTHPAQRNPVRDVLAAVAVDLAKPFTADDLEAIDKRFILRPKADDPLRTLADNVAHNLGVVGFDVWRSQARRAGVEAQAAATPVLSVGLDVTRTHPTREQRFLLARKLYAIHAGHHVLRGLDVRGLSLLLTAIGRSLDRAFPALVVTDAAEIDALTKKVSSALSRKAKGVLVDPLAQIAAAPRAVDLQAFLVGAAYSENRAGLLLSGALDAALRLVARDAAVTFAGDTQAMVATIEAQPMLTDLIGYAVSDEFFQARQALRLAIDT
jgi:tetratricopeptide (TPR) repeat protein